MLTESALLVDAWLAICCDTSELPLNPTDAFALISTPDNSAEVSTERSVLHPQELDVEEDLEVSICVVETTEECTVCDRSTERSRVEKRLSKMCTEPFLEDVTGAPKVTGPIAMFGNALSHKINPNKSVVICE